VSAHRSSGLNASVEAPQVSPQTTPSRISIVVAELAIPTEDYGALQLTLASVRFATRTKL
jgi:hypothetical protein